MRKKQKSFYKILETAARKGVQKREAEETVDVPATVLRLRKERHLASVELCRRARDLDPKTLSALEKGRIRNPSIQTLRSLARGLQISVSDLFRHSEDRQDRNIYLGSQKGFYHVDFPIFGIKVVSFTPFVKDFFCGKVILGAHKKLDNMVLKHPLPIYISMLMGRVEGKVESKPVTLKEGENLFFNGILEHSFYNPLEREAVFLLVTAPSFL